MDLLLAKFPNGDDSFHSEEYNCVENHIEYTWRKFYKGRWWKCSDTVLFRTTNNNVYASYIRKPEEPTEDEKYMY